MISENQTVGIARHSINKKAMGLTAEKPSRAQRHLPANQSNPTEIQFSGLFSEFSIQILPLSPKQYQKFLFLNEKMIIIISMGGRWGRRRSRRKK